MRTETSCMVITGLDHVNINTEKPKETVEFYSKVLGFTNTPESRPPSVVPGTWMCSLGYPTLHINFIDSKIEKSTGCIDHIAFKAENASHVEKNVSQLKIPYEISQSKERDLVQLFLFDPNGIKIELNITEVDEQVDK